MQAQILLVHGIPWSHCPPPCPTWIINIGGSCLESPSISFRSCLQACPSMEMWMTFSKERTIKNHKDASGRIPAAVRRNDPQGDFQLSFCHSGILTVRSIMCKTYLNKWPRTKWNKPDRHGGQNAFNTLLCAQ